MQLLDQLGLVQVADTIIGDEARRGVSGGERRRVSIGTDIIHDPLLLFLDEPTSGLDSTSAYMVVRPSVRARSFFFIVAIVWIVNLVLRISSSVWIVNLVFRISSKYDCQFDFQNNFPLLENFQCSKFLCKSIMFHYFLSWVIS